MINVNFSEDFNNIINGLHKLQYNLEIELKAINNRIDYLESKQHKDDEFFKNLQALIDQRNSL